MLSIRDIDKTTSHREKIHPPEQNKKNKRQNSNIQKIGTFCKKRMLWENYLEKKSGSKTRINSKNQSEPAACEQKPLARYQTFVQTPFSHSTWKLERKKSRRKTNRFSAPLPDSAWPKSLIQFDFKNHENVWTDLKKKDSAPIQFKFFDL